MNSFQHTVNCVKRFKEETTLFVSGLKDTEPYHGAVGVQGEIILIDERYRFSYTAVTEGGSPLLRADLALNIVCKPENRKKALCFLMTITLSEACDISYYIDDEGRIHACTQFSASLLPEFTTDGMDHVLLILWNRSKPYDRYLREVGGGSDDKRTEELYLRVRAYRDNIGGIIPHAEKLPLVQAVLEDSLPPYIERRLRAIDEALCREYYDEDDDNTIDSY